MIRSFITISLSIHFVKRCPKVSNLLYLDNWKLTLLSHIREHVTFEWKLIEAKCKAMCPFSSLSFRSFSNLGFDNILFTNMSCPCFVATCNIFWPKLFNNLDGSRHCYSRNISTALMYPFLVDIWIGRSPFMLYKRACCLNFVKMNWIPSM